MNFWPFRRKASEPSPTENLAPFSPCDPESIEPASAEALVLCEPIPPAYLIVPERIGRLILDGQFDHMVGIDDIMESVGITDVDRSLTMMNSHWQ